MTARPLWIGLTLRLAGCLLTIGLLCVMVSVAGGLWHLTSLLWRIGSLRDLWEDGRTLAVGVLALAAGAALGLPAFDRHLKWLAALSPADRERWEVREVMSLSRVSMCIHTGLAARWRRAAPPVRLSDDPALRALQTALQRAGAATRRLRIGAFAGMLAALFGLVAALHAGPHTGDWWLETLFAWFGLCLVGLWPFCLLALPAGAGARACFRRRLRPRLEALTPDQRAEVLLPLRQDESLDTSDIVEPLIRCFGVQANEVTPSEEPVGRGDELSPRE